MRRKGAAAVPPEGFFVFSSPQEHKGSLCRWEHWFASKGIPTVYIQQENGKWVLCREGVEAGVAEHNK